MRAALPAKYVHLGPQAIHCLHTGPTTLPDVPPALDRGTLFVLLHCAGGCAGMWQKVMAALADHHSAIAIDLPAHGRSGGVEGPATIDAMVDCVTAVADALRLRRFVLVGHSMGGNVALAFAARHPARLAGLGVACAVTAPKLGEVIPRLRDVVRGRVPQQFTPELFSPSATPDVMREFFTLLVTTDPRVRLADFEALDGFDCAPLLPRIGLPTLVVAGADDGLAVPDRCRAIADGVAGARFETIAAAGHALPVEQPAALATLLDGFAGGLR